MIWLFLILLVVIGLAVCYWTDAFSFLMKD